MTTEQIDGYWLRMGHLAIDAMMSRSLTKSSLSPEEISEASEWLAGLFSNAHDMGMRLGEMRERFTSNRQGGEE